MILLAIILFIVEIKVPTHGLLSIGAVISLLLGSFMLINTGSSLEGARLSTAVIITTVIVISSLFILLIYLVVKARMRKVESGVEGMIGEIGEVIDEIIFGKGGAVKVHGEIWNAELKKAVDEKIEPGDKVKVVSVNNLKLIVEKI